MLHKPNFLVGYRVNSLEHDAIPCVNYFYRAANKSLARPRRKQATATEDFEFHTSYL
jgi:hypothetical protein